MNIRVAAPEDAASLLRIYQPYIENTAVSFEYDVPSEEEFRQRITRTLEKYPYLAAEENGEIIGYAYADQFHSRRAFIYGAELSVYVDREHRGKGIGRTLYERITEILQQQNVLRLYACIAAADDPNDPYLTDGSIRFHEREGFVKTCYHERCGYKFDRWYGIVWMEKSIGEHDAAPKPFIPFSEVESMYL